MSDLVIRFVRSASDEAEALTGYRKSARALKVREGLLPPPVALGGRATAFIQDELQAVAAARSAGATDDQVRDLVTSLVNRRPTRLNDQPISRGAA